MSPARSGLAPPLLQLLPRAARVTHLQVACDGAWESATRAVVGEPAGLVERLLSRIDGREELALELFGRDRADRMSFVGVRLRGADVSRAQELIRASWSASNAVGASLTDLAGCLARQLASPLFTLPAERAEVGVIDAWRSSGARELWKASAEPWPDDLEARAHAAAPLLHRDAGASLALELATLHPLEHWIGLEFRLPHADS